MTEKRKPWSKWYWGDWRKDVRLHRCSYAARGLWADMLSLMGGECDEFGYLILEGAPLEAADLAGLVGGGEKEIKKLIAELEAKGVFSRVGGEMPDDVKALVIDGVPNGTVISRRMIRDKAKEEKDRENGKGGGNPKLRQNDDERLSQNRTGGLTGGDKAQRLEARDKKLDSPPLPSTKVSGATTDEPSLATQIIRAFDDTRADQFGESNRRHFWNARDTTEVTRWISEGADLDLCREVFRAGMKTWRGKDLPKWVGVFTPDIGEALTARANAKANVEFDEDAQELTRKRIRVLVNAGFSEERVKELGSIHRIPDEVFEALIAQVRPVAEGAAA